MKKIIIVLLCLSSLLCFARKCDDCGQSSPLHMRDDGLFRKICFDCYYTKSVKKSQEDDTGFGLLIFASLTFVLWVIATVYKISHKKHYKKHSSPRNSFRNNKVDEKSKSTINCNQNTAENAVNKGSFVFSCPHCDCKLKSDTEWTGMECECPQCHKKIVIPPNSTNL